jgi:hypothetical protein
MVSHPCVLLVLPLSSMSAANQQDGWRASCRSACPSLVRELASSMGPEALPVLRTPLCVLPVRPLNAPSTREHIIRVNIAAIA